MCQNLAHFFRYFSNANCFAACPAGRAHYAWGDHFVVGMSCLTGVSCMGPRVARRMHDPDQREDRCFLVCPRQLKTACERPRSAQEARPAGQSLVGEGDVDGVALYDTVADSRRLGDDGAGVGDRLGGGWRRGCRRWICRRGRRGEVEVFHAGDVEADGGDPR